ncbi:TetR/AcrR family transcriptional regulator [Cryobacterium aureum]|uniref:TetR/AcrR family transcriptional regulator n=1 Tax=Cryobacterium aureum TaxID=995037 RepID=UPI000CF524AE|nr:TetR/AcrR family transcriptional regulator [Cryobacterium aureum]
MARPKDQGKRRDQLIAAAASAVLIHGSTGARLADIAEEAGLSSASVLYYYPDVRVLYTAVFEQGSVEYCVHREGRVAEFTTPIDRLYACIRSGIPRQGTAEEASRILFELTPIVLRNAVAAAQHQAFILRQVALYERVLAECEASGQYRLLMPRKMLARSFVALEDGYGIDVLIATITADEEEEWLCSYARTMVVAT